jgi:hypothetical protein
MRKVDLTGQRFGRLTVLSVVVRNRSRRWLCRCDCGNELDVARNNLRSGCTKSCGCLRREKAAEKCRTHGKSHMREYDVWCSMKNRCLNPNDQNYYRYGGRGITVCDRWQRSFEAFISDMGPRPSSKHSIEREDNDGPYDPDNCVWATRSMQSSNIRPRGLVQVAVDGKLRTAAEWARRLGTSQSTILCRIKAGWDPVRAVTQPVKKLKRKKVA